MNAANNCAQARRKGLLCAIATYLASVSAAAAAAPLPVLMVLANQDFHHAEYAAIRASLEARGLTVAVAAGERRLAQPQGAGPAVRPDFALAQVSPAQYSAIVFVGGWGASSYQYAFEGTYQHAAYRPQPAVTGEVNRLVEEFSANGKPVAAICHGVTVLAWARVDGASPLNGRVVVGPAGGTPAFRFRGIDYPNAEQPARWQVEMNGATMLTSGSVGNPMSTTDDVWVDGQIITAENYDSAARFAEVIAQSVAASRN